MKITEEGMFRVVVWVGLAMVPVILLAVLWSPLAGAILFGLELGFAIGVLIQRWRAAPRRQVEMAPNAGDGVHRVLVVANETVGGRALRKALGQRLGGEERNEVLVVVPPLAGSAAEHWSSDVDGYMAEARDRLEGSVAAMRESGLSVTGRLADHHDPNEAIRDALRGFRADEVVISTHPPARSRWLESGVVARARQELPQPVTHVVVDLEAERSAGP